MNTLFLFVVIIASATADLSLVSLKDQDRGAVCTDGSPAAYYWKPAKDGSSRHIWILHHEGGGWCYNQESCEKRCGSPANPRTQDTLCSSKHFSSSQPLAGIFWPTNDSKLGNANKAFIKYCTSDAHMGDGEAFGFQFRGARVLQAVLKDLVRRGLGSGPHIDTLVYGGSSAGGRGAMVHIDYLPEMLGSASAYVDIRGFLDSPLWIDLPPYSSRFVGFAKETQGVHSYANVTHLGAECAATYDPESQWKCLFGQYRMPSVRTPYLLVASQDDAFQLGENGLHQPVTDTEKSYEAEFASRTGNQVRSLRNAWPASAAKQNAVYSWACHNHAVATQSDGFNRKTCNGVTMHSALLQFLGLQQSGNRTLEWIDNCTGFNCGPGCEESTNVVVV